MVELGVHRYGFAASDSRGRLHVLAPDSRCCVALAQNSKTGSALVCACLVTAAGYFFDRLGGCIDRYRSMIRLERMEANYDERVAESADCGPHNFAFDINFDRPNSFIIIKILVYHYDSIKSEFSEDKIGTFLGQIFLMVVCQQEVLGAFALWDILLYVLWEHAADRVLFLEA